MAVITGVVFDALNALSKAFEQTTVRLLKRFRRRWV
jgi:hypothetical protein